MSYCRCLVLAGLLAAAGGAAARPGGDGATCADVAVLASPAHPRTGVPLRVIVAGERGTPAALVLEDPEGQAAEGVWVAAGGPPWSTVATIDRPVAGIHRVGLRRDGTIEPCEAVTVVEAATAGRVERPRRGAWPSERAWDRETEALYATWIEHLFAAPLEEELSFPSLDPVLRDPARNFLHGHLGLGEDGPAGRERPITPDCADLPYVLRAYFAWKLGLPFGFRRCDRGSAAAPPRCGAVTTNEDLPAAGDPRRAFAAAARTIADTVHSGSARTAIDDESSDLYPVGLAREALRPGTVFADPYGHTLVVAAWVAQRPDRAGILLAVDAQPDDTVARKRFWEGTFLFADVRNAGPGFKAFRPLVRDASGSRLRPLTNAELADDPRFARWSGEQAALDPESFYARMATLVNPDGLEPERAYDAALDALVEQLEARVRAVENGERFVREHAGTTIAMPRGAAIFETTGPWEDYATPSRDFRLLIAIRVLETLPARIVREPALFRTGERSPAQARADVERLHRERIGTRTVEYERSDGTAWRLTVADVLARKAALEVAYNPNDCVEVRWGAADASDEGATCRRRAPADQRARMEEYRPWLRDSRRPSR